METGRLYQEWRGLYGESCDSDNTVECVKCNNTVYGDSPIVAIICWTCYQKMVVARPAEKGA